jgi:hypothetical protein
VKRHPCSSAVVWLVLLVVFSCPNLVVAQVETGAICVATFADSNANGQPDPDETALAGVNINLITGGVIIATHITEAGETEHCFENLLTGIYTVTFTDSPLYQPTTAQEGTFEVAGQRLTVNAFGAFPIPAANLRAHIAAQYAEPESPLDEPTRLMLATGGSMLVMLFMVGIGAVILGLLSGRTRKGGRLPQDSNKKSQKRRTQDAGMVIPPSDIRPPAH